MADSEQVCRIVVDLHERASGIPELLRTAGVAIEERRLDAGDYVLPNGVVVERKSVADLHLTLRAGRLWRQLHQLRRAARSPYVLLEGRSLDIAGGSPPTAIRGACLAISGLGIAVVRSTDPADSAVWLQLLAQRSSGRRAPRDRPVYAQVPKRPECVAEAMLAAVPAVSVHRARLLLDHFGSLADVVNARPEAWLEVPGIGRSCAEALRRAVGPA